MKTSVLYPPSKSKAATPVKVPTMRIVNREAMALAQKLCRTGSEKDWNRAMFVLTGVYDIPDDYWLFYSEN